MDVNAPTLSPTHESSERDRLELDELRLRLRDLTRPWWQRPTVMAPLATITAAIVGVIWAMATGFFDVAKRELVISKRELEYETRELRDKRDRQSLEFKRISNEIEGIRKDLANKELLLRKRSVEIEEQNAAIRELRGQEQQLLARVRDADRPIISKGTATEISVGGPHATLRLFGTSFGTRAGAIALELHTDCAYGVNAQRITREGVTSPVPVHAGAWSPTWVTASIARTELESIRRRAQERLRRNPTFVDRKDCREWLTATIVRDDAKKSNETLILAE